MVWTSFKREAKLSLANGALHPKLVEHSSHFRKLSATLRKARDESIPAIHHAAGGNSPADGCPSADWHRCLSRAASFSPAASRLSDNSSYDFLSRREPRCDGVVGYFAAGTPIWSGPGAHADDLEQLRRLLDYHAAF